MGDYYIYTVYIRDIIEKPTVFKGFDIGNSVQKTAPKRNGRATERSRCYNIYGK